MRFLNIGITLLFLLTLSCCSSAPAQDRIPWGEDPNGDQGLIQENENLVVPVGGTVGTPSGGGDWALNVNGAALATLADENLTVEGFLDSNHNVLVAASGESVQSQFTYLRSPASGTQDGARQFGGQGLYTLALSGTAEATDDNLFGGLRGRASLTNAGSGSSANPLLVGVVGIAESDEEVRQIGLLGLLPDNNDGTVRIGLAAGVEEDDALTASYPAGAWAAYLQGRTRATNELVVGEATGAGRLALSLPLFDAQPFSGISAPANDSALYFWEVADGASAELVVSLPFSDDSTLYSVTLRVASAAAHSAGTRPSIEGEVFKTTAAGVGSSLGTIPNVTTTTDTTAVSTTVTFSPVVALVAGDQIHIHVTVDGGTIATGGGPARWIGVDCVMEQRVY